MGGIVGPRQATLAMIRKTAKCRVELVSQPNLNSKDGNNDGVLRIGPAPEDILARCEELIQIKSEELLGVR